eukprot:3096745-Amphidinium_carterae.2
MMAEGDDDGDYEESNLSITTADRVEFLEAELHKVRETNGGLQDAIASMQITLDSVAADVRSLSKVGFSSKSLPRDVDDAPSYDHGWLLSSQRPQPAAPQS